MKNYIFILILFLFYSCNKIKTKIDYYDDGGIKQKIEYNSIFQRDAYCKREYYKNGVLKRESCWENNVKNGYEKNYYDNGKLESVIPFKKGVKTGIGSFSKYYDSLLIKATVSFVDGEYHGVSNLREYNNKQVLYYSKEMLFLKNTKVVEKEGGVYEDSSYLYTFWYNKKSIDSLRPIGSLRYNYDSSINRDYSSYFETISRDTIFNGDSLKIGIKMYIGLLRGYELKLSLGALDENLNFKDDNIRIIESDSYILKFSIGKEDYEKGINLLTGKIDVYKNDEKITHKHMFNNRYKSSYIFYHQFHVIDSK